MIEVRVQSPYGGTADTVQAASITYDPSCFEIVKKARTSTVWVNGEDPNWSSAMHDIEIRPNHRLQEMLRWFESVRNNLPTQSDIITLRQMSIEYMSPNPLNLQDPGVEKAFINLLLVSKLARENPR